MSEGELIFLVWNDLVGLSRTRGVPLSEYERRREHGLGWVPAGQSLTPFGDIADNPWGPVGEVRQIPDEATRCRVELRNDYPPLHLVFCDSLHADDGHWECCTRSFMRKALADLEAETGLTLRVAGQNEFLLHGEGIEWASPFSLTAVRRITPFIDLCVAALLSGDVDLETFDPRFGAGQYEVTCGPAAGVAGADRIVLTRELIREAARQCQLHATFTPKSTPEGPSNSCHLHLSLWDEFGNAAAYDPEGPGGMSEVACRFVAGVQRHMRALTLLTAPSPVSYLRLGPHRHSCGYDAVGVHNREAAIRIRPDPDPKNAGAAFSIEYRATDATASPYLAIGAIARAGLEGIREALSAPVLIDHDPADMSGIERAALDIHELPTSLEQALVAFEDDEAAQSWLSSTMVQAYTSLKREEAEMFARSSPEEMCERYGLAY